MDIKQNVSLAPYSTFKIGGGAQYFVKAVSKEEIIEALNWAGENNLLYKVIGGGSNVVFPDEGIQGLVIRISGGEMVIVGDKVKVFAGVTLEHLINETVKEGLSGLEYLVGIPGTIGGAIVGNAGAYGHDVSEVVEEVTVWDSGKIIVITKEECQFAYRSSGFKGKDKVILETGLSFRKGDREAIEKRADEILQRRIVKWPVDLACPGSYYKNIFVKDLNATQIKNISPEKIVYGKIPAGFLLDQVGALGMQEGNIAVSDYHGNLILNKGDGKSSDVKKLAAILKEKVRAKFAIELEEEIRYF